MEETNRDKKEDLVAAVSSYGLSAASLVALVSNDNLLMSPFNMLNAAYFGDTADKIANAAYLFSAMQLYSADVAGAVLGTYFACRYFRED